MYENSYLKIFKLLTLGLFLTNLKNTSKTIINLYADIRFPCHATLSNFKYFAVFPLLMMQDSWFKNHYNQITKIYTDTEFLTNLQ